MEYTRDQRNTRQWATKAKLLQEPTEVDLSAYQLKCMQVTGLNRSKLKHKIPRISQTAGSKDLLNSTKDRRTYETMASSDRVRLKGSSRNIMENIKQRQSKNSSNRTELKAVKCGLLV